MERLLSALLRLVGVVATAALIVFATALVVIRGEANHGPTFHHDGPDGRHYADAFRTTDGGLPGEER